MHESCRIFYNWVASEFPTFFNESILEIGSYNVNGSIRESFKNYKEYIGVDWREGPNVELVSLAHELKLDKKFKAILSANMLEHDPYWKDSIENMISHLKSGGILVLSWGGATCQEHHNDTAPDQKFHALKAGLVIDLLRKNNLFVYAFGYDSKLKNFIPEANGVKGTIKVVNLVAFKELFIDGLIKADQI